MSENEKEKEAAAKAAKPKMFRIKILRDCVVGNVYAEDGSIKTPGLVKLPGTICEVNERDMKDLCETKYQGYFPFYGTMPEIGPLLGEAPNPLARRQLVRAVLVA